VAVPAYSRGDNLLQVFSSVRGLLVFTIRTTRNEAHFKRRHHDDLGAPIVALTRRMMHGVFEADAVDSTTEDGKARRVLLQEDVAMAHSALLAEVMVAHDMGLKPAKLREWTILLNDFYAIFSKWRRSGKSGLLGR